MQTKVMAKVAAVATGLAMATSMLSLAPIAHAAALTDAQVQSILGLLSSFGADSATLANVTSALTGGAVTPATPATGAVACDVGTANLTIGSSGAAVTSLQKALIAAGYAIPAGATGYFGAQTQAAVIAWQKAAGVTPASGYFGPISRAAFNLCGTAVVTPPTTTTVPGCAAGAAFSATTGQACTTTGTPAATGLTGSGRLTSVNFLSDVTNDLEVGDGETSVIGISADATGGDVAIQRVDATFTIASTGSQSSNLDKYVSDVSLYLNGTKLASMNPTAGDKDGRVWTLRFSGLNGVIKAGTTGQLYVKVTPVASVGANEDSVSTAHNVTAALLTNSVRAVAADGISDTYVTRVAANDQTFTVSSATTGSITLSLANDNPTASIISTGSTTTAGVKLLSFNAKAKNSAVTITDAGASIGVSSASTVGAVVSNVKLMQGTTVVKTGTINDTSSHYSTVTFSSVNKTIAKDDTEAFWISVDLKNDSGYIDGTTIIASTTASALWDMSDADGATVTPNAAVAGNSQTLIGTGLVTVTLNGTPTATKETGTTAGTYDKVNGTISINVTAGPDSDIYLDATLMPGLITVLTGSSGFGWATTTDSTTGTTTSATLSAGGDTDSLDSAGSYYRIAAGATRTFTLTAAITAGNPNTAAGVRFTGFNYGTTAAGMTNVYNYNLGAFKTPTIPGLILH